MVDESAPIPVRSRAPAHAVVRVLAVEGLLRREQQLSRATLNECPIEHREAEPRQILCCRQEATGGPLIAVVFSRGVVQGTGSIPVVEASAMRDEPRKQVKKERNRVLRELAAEKNFAFRCGLLGREFDAVTLDQHDAASTRALTDNYIPVRISDGSLDPGITVRIRMSRCDDQRTFADLT